MKKILGPLVHGRLLCVAPFIVLVGTIGCATAPSSRNPFAGEAQARTGSGNFRVHLDVGCDRCLISYSVGAESFNLEGPENSRTWTRSLWVDATWEPVVIRLSASPGSSVGSPVRFVRIQVDGKVVARAGEEDGGLPSGSHRTLSVETVVPPG